jgi:hypothetical protein
VLQKRLEEKINELFDTKLKKFQSQLEKLSGKGTVVCGNHCRPSVSSESNQVHDTDDGHSNLLPSVPPAVSNCQGNCKSDVNENEYTLTECDRVQANIGASRKFSKSDVLVGSVQHHSSVMGDLNLPKFSDCKSQHTVKFLGEFDRF